MSVLMALTIDSIVPGCCIYKDVEWIPSYHALQGLQSRRLVCAPIHHVILLIIAVGINFRRKAVPRNLFSKKAFSKYPKINPLRN